MKDGGHFYKWKDSKNNIASESVCVHMFKTVIYMYHISRPDSDSEVTHSHKEVCKSTNTNKFPNHPKL